MNTDANSLLAGANQLQLISDALAALQVQISVLQAIAGTNYTAQQLLGMASQYQEISDATTARQVIISLLASIVNNGGGGGCGFQNMEIAWTPTNLKLGEMLGFYTNVDLPGITAITFEVATSLGGCNLVGTSELASFSAPNLVSIDPLNLTGASGIELVSCTALTSVNLPKLTTVSSSTFIAHNPLLTTLNLPLLVQMGVTGTSNGFNDNSLTSLNLPNLMPSNGNTDSYANNALPSANVNAILARYVANAAYVSGVIDLSGGTNAAPTGQGVTDAATLTGRGVSVVTN